MPLHQPCHLIFTCEKHGSEVVGVHCQDACPQLTRTKCSGSCGNMLLYIPCSARRHMQQLSTSWVLPWISMAWDTLSLYRLPCSRNFGLGQCTLMSRRCFTRHCKGGRAKRHTTNSCSTLSHWYVTRHPAWCTCVLYNRERQEGGNHPENSIS